MKNIIPKTGKKEWFNNLKKLFHDKLLKLGMKIWDKKGGRVHYLYPATWYDEIPNGLLMVDIFGKQEIFKHGITDDDQRFGALPYGFIK